MWQVWAGSGSLELNNGSPEREVTAQLSFHSYRVHLLLDHCKNVVLKVKLIVALQHEKVRSVRQRLSDTQTLHIGQRIHRDSVDYLRQKSSADSMGRRHRDVTYQPRFHCDEVHGQVCNDLLLVAANTNGLH